MRSNDDLPLSLSYEGLEQGGRMQRCQGQATQCIVTGRIAGNHHS